MAEVQYIMVGFEFSRFQHHVPKRTPKKRKKGSERESKWNQDPEKESPELILDAMKASAKKMLQKSHEEVSGTARAGPRAGPGCPYNKGKT